MGSWISIHAPRVGSDSTQHGIPSNDANFNPRSPCGERRGDTPDCKTGCADFNPRSPCGERHALLRTCTPLPAISIHAPRVGSDHHILVLSGNRANFNPRSPCGERRKTREQISGLERFQSTLPVWGATFADDKLDRQLIISIHAPRVGSDNLASAGSLLVADFNPRSPCGERPRTRF